MAKKARVKVKIEEGKKSDSTKVKAFSHFRFKPYRMSTGEKRNVVIDQQRARIDSLKGKIDSLNKIILKKTVKIEIKDE